MCRFLNADAYASTGQGLLGNNMFAYCLNNSVNFCDKSGETADSYAGWIGEQLGKLIYEWITGDDHPAQETERIERDIIQKQNDMIQSGARALWNAYQRAYELEQETIMLQAELNLDMFDSPEDIERSIDVIEATVGFSIAVYEVATIVTVANPPVGAVIWAIAGVAWSGRAIYRACQ